MHQKLPGTSCFLSTRFSFSLYFFSCKTTKHNLFDEETIGILYEGNQANMTFEQIPLGMGYK